MPATRRLRTRLAVAACAVVTGCALLQPPTSEGPLQRGEIKSAQAARNALSIGKSTRADVRAALGEAIVVDFHSSYEVWVYRERLRPKEPPPTELVLMFAPSGILTKMRLRQSRAG
jgi:outer membrane protein assembly factor BamE (lipoprotein component of BamABCDE complex)